MRRSVIVFLIALGARSGAAQPVEAGCAQGSALIYELGFRVQSGSFQRIEVTDTRTSQTTVYTIGGEVDGTGGCHWVAYVGEPHTNPEPNEALLLANVRYNLRFVANEDEGEYYEYSYMLCKDPPRSSPQEPPMPRGTVYCPYGDTVDSPDILFYYQTGNLRITPLSLFAGALPHLGGDVDDYFPAGSWVLPLNARNVCEARLDCRADNVLQLRDTPFLTPRVGPPYAVSHLHTSAFPLNAETAPTQLDGPLEWH